MTIESAARIPDVGVIVGRFQVPDLHDGHRALIDYVCERHRKVIVVLGTSPVPLTVNNPLDYQARAQMFREAYPDIITTQVRDTGDDHYWSGLLDATVNDLLGPREDALIYGGRDSFISHYFGTFPTEALRQEGYASGSAVRDLVRKECINTPDFRAGVIWASANRFPTVYTCVDVAVMDPDKTKLVLGQHANGTDGDKFRLPGGFADPGAPNFESDAYRELSEETHMTVLFPVEYLGSFTVDDYRYRNEVDEIRTLLFFGVSQDQPHGDDDFCNAQWFDLEKLRERTDEIVISDHLPLVERVLDHVG